MPCQKSFHRKLAHLAFSCVAAVAFSSAAFLPSTSQADLIYNNTLPTGQYQTVSRTGPGFSTFGDDVTFSAPQSIITDVTFQLTATQSSGNPVGSLVMYVYDDNNGTTGDLLGFGFLPNFAFSGNGDQDVTFSGLAINVPESAFIGLAVPDQDFGRPAPTGIGIGFGGTPDVGTSDASSWIVVNGAGFQIGTALNSSSPVPGLPSNFLIQVQTSSVPEPGLVPAIVLSGLILLFGARRKQPRPSA